MTSAVIGADGNPYTITTTDYVRPDHLDAYVADARTRWQIITIDDPQEG